MSATLTPPADACPCWPRVKSQTLPNASDAADGDDGLLLPNGVRCTLDRTGATCARDQGNELHRQAREPPGGGAPYQREQSFFVA